MKKYFLLLLSLLVLSLGQAHAADKDKPALSIATGGTGGVYYPLGGAMSTVIKKYLGNEVTVEVTGGSVENIKLLAGKKTDIGFSMADAALDAYKGEGKFKEKEPVRAIALFYPNNMQVVTLEGKKIDKLADLKGKRVSIGSPGSGGEIMSKRLLSVLDIDPDKDIKAERLGVAESVSALKDGKIDAFMWVGGIPTAAITDLAATPGDKMKLINHGEAAEKMSKKFGEIYVAGTIPKGSYPNQDKEVSNIIVWNILVVNADAKDQDIYDLTKVLFEKKDELVAVHKDAAALSLKSQKNPPIPFHPGAVKYFKEKGIQ